VESKQLDCHGPAVKHDCDHLANPKSKHKRKRVRYIGDMPSCSLCRKFYSGSRERNVKGFGSSHVLSNARETEDDEAVTPFAG